MGMTNYFFCCIFTFIYCATWYFSL